jgi:hypothetical protein
MIPQNELGVIVLFAQQSGTAGFEIVEIQADFPDAIVEKDGQHYRAEFEHLASGFLQHRHDVRACDLVICWENDWPDCILPILALSKENWQGTLLDLPTEAERKAAYWKQRALLAESRLKRVQTENASSDLLAKLSFGPKRERILFAATQWPTLKPSAIAVLTESSPAYVSEVLGDDGNSSGEILS